MTLLDEHGVGSVATSEGIGGLQAVEVGVLGPVTATVGTRRVTLGGPKDRGVLAMLALAAPRAVGEGALVDGLWGDNPPKTAGKVLQNQVARLRKACRTAGSGVAMIVTTPGGYRLGLPTCAVDLGAATALIEDGRAAIGAGDPATASELFSSALDRWRGDALSDVGDLPFAAAPRAHLGELRWTLREERVAADLACGRHHVLVPELQEAVAVAPLRERFWEQLLTALYRCGRQAEALRAFQDLRARLGDELGLAPGARVVALERAIAAGNDEVLGVHVNAQFHAVGWAVRATPVVSPMAIGGAARLLRPRTRLIGRTQDLAQVGELLAATGVVTIVGPGGVGKTRLALAAADFVAPSYRDGVVLVDLAALHEEQSVAPAAAAAVGVTIDADESPVQSLVRGLGDRRILVVLDNCEHVIAAAAALAETVTQGCPDVHILSTSREALRIDGEAIWRLAPLTVPDPEGSMTSAVVGESLAVEMFVDRAALMVPGFRLDDSNAPILTAIVSGLDGIPLALELAAAALDEMGVDGLAASLADRFEVLKSGRRTAHARQATLWATIDWSYAGLDPAEQLILDRLSLFSADFGEQAAAEVCGSGFPPGEAVERLHRLVTRSLVQSVHGADARFRLLDSVRDFAQRHLDGRGDRAGEQLRDWAVRFALPTTEAMERGDDAPALETLDREYANLIGALRSAVDARDTTNALQLVGALGPYWNARGRKGEGHRWCLAALDLPPVDADDAARGVALWAAAETTPHVEETEAASYLAAAEEAALASGDMTLLAKVWLEQGLIASRSAGFAQSETADRLYQQVADLARRCGDHVAWAEATERLSRSPDSLPILLEAAAVHRRAKHRRGLFWCLAAQLLWNDVDPADGFRIADECLMLARELRFPFEESWSLSRMGFHLSLAGDPDGAIATYGAASVICRRIREGNHLSWALRGLARAHSQRGDIAAAIEALTEVASGHSSGEIHPHEIGRLLRDAAIALGAAGEIETAATLIGARAAGSEAFVDPAFDEDAYRRIDDACQAALGGDKYAVAREAGARADPVALISSALTRTRERRELNPLATSHRP